MTEFQSLGRLTTAAGTVDVLHRLALAVEPQDAVLGRAVPDVRVGWEVPRRVLELNRGRRGGGGPDPQLFLDPSRPLEGVRRHLVRYGRSTPARLRLRITDPALRLMPRRLEVPLWPLAAVEACDPGPGRAGTGAYLRAEDRLVSPWLLPAPSWPVPAGTTGARLRLVDPAAPGPAVAPVPVPWARIQAYGSGGALIGWAHGDRNGDALLVLPRTAGGYADHRLPPIDVLLWVFRLDPGQPPAVDPRVPQPGPPDPLADLPLEQVSAAGRLDALDQPVVQGWQPPPRYGRALSVVRQLTVAAVTDITLAVPTL
jgi:hypothetical protein